MQETGRYKIKLSALLYHQWFFLINWTIAAEFYATSFILWCFSFFGSYLIACPIFSPKFPVKRIQLVSFFSNDNSAQIILNWLFCWNFCTVGTRFCWWWQWTFLFCHFSFYSQSLHGNSSISAASYMGKKIEVSQNSWEQHYCGIVIMDWFAFLFPKSK